MKRSSTLTVRKFSLFLLLVTLVACQSDRPDEATPTLPADTAVTPAVANTEAAATGAAAVPPTHTNVPPTDMPAPTATPEPELITVLYADGTESTQPPLPPVSYDELLEIKVASGEWTESEGLIQLLKLFADEVSLAELPETTTVLSESATGIVRQAHELARDPDTDTAVRAEIERLLSILTPSQAALDLYSIPEEEAGADKPAGLARRAAQNDSCVDLAAEGFPTDDVADFPCFSYREAQVNGFRYRAYYPLTWQGEDEKEELVDTALTALTDSAATFHPLATMKDVNVVFGLRPYPGDNRLAHQAPFDLDNACPITLFPSAQTKASESFQQTIAHEVFHCVQEWNFTTSPYATHKWWIEGSAEYFSNVVYPEVNDEHRFLGNFNFQSIDKSLMEMHYHNFIFFQYLGNQIGDAQIIALLKTMSAAGGHAAQAQVLAGTGDMAGLFQDFVVSFMSEGIPDTGGGMIFVALTAVTRIEPVDAEGMEEFVVRPFVPARFGLRYEQEKRFLQEGQPGAGGNHSAVIKEQRRDKSSWSDVPPEVRSSCGDDSVYLLVVTSVESDYTFKVDVNTVEQAECDPCLLGTWDMDPESFAEFIRRIVATTEGSMAMDISVAGHDYMQFNEEGEMVTLRDGFQIIFSVPNSPAIVTTIDGHGGAKYSADGETLTVVNLVQVVDRVTTAVGDDLISTTLTPGTTTYNFLGESFSGPGTDLDDGGPDSGAASYICSEETLTLTMPEYGDILFHRVEEILPTPVPTPGP